MHGSTQRDRAWDLEWQVNAIVHPRGYLKKPMPCHPRVRKGTGTGPTDGHCLTTVVRQCRPSEHCEVHEVATTVAAAALIMSMARERQTSTPTW